MGINGVGYYIVCVVYPNLKAEVSVMRRISVLLLLVFCHSLPAFAQVGDYLKAPVIKDYLIVNGEFSIPHPDTIIGLNHISPLDGKTIGQIAANAPILTKTKFKIAYYRYNPLRVGISVNTEDVEDPGHAALISLLDGIQKFASARDLTPPNKAELVAGNCKGDLKSATDDAKLLLKELVDAVQQWPVIIDNDFSKNNKTGPQAITDLLDNNITKKEEAVSACEAALSSTITQGGNAAKATDASAASEVDVALRAADKSLVALKEKLELVNVDGKWVGPNKQAFIVSDDLSPTTSIAKKTTVEIDVIGMSVVDNVVTASDKGTTSFTFTVRHLWPLLPAISGGAVVGFMNRPKYSVKPNTAGQNVVSFDGYDSHRLDTTVICNFIPHFDHHSSVIPLLQAGVSTSTVLPAVLLGGGFRLFGLPKGDFVIGGGAMIGWYKDLDKLHVGDAVTGSDDLTNDLRFRNTPKTSGYLAIQYSF